MKKNPKKINKKNNTNDSLKMSYSGIGDAITTNKLQYLEAITFVIIRCLFKMRVINWGKDHFKHQELSNQTFIKSLTMYHLVSRHLYLET